MSAPSEFRCEPVKLHADARGCVFEPLSPDEIPLQRNAHYVASEPGAIRGNHYHRRGTEIVVALGRTLVRVRQGNVTRDFVIPAGEAWRFVFPPGVAHAFKNIGDQAAAMIAFNTEPHDPAQPDVVREALIES
jgi:dTDP-4-dehydrorhamnose 3,5-epimerase-like enzyme